MKRVEIGLAIWMSVLVAHAGQLEAGELCVVCAEPAATYRCAVEGDSPAGPAEPGIQLYCIKELASINGHKTCSVDRTRGHAPCEGTAVVLARPTGGTLPAIVPVPAVAAPDKAAQSQQPAGAIPAPEGPPPTVEALAKETAEQSKKDWDQTTAKVKDTTQKAGDAVGGAVKKSWDCVTSLFSRC